MRWDLGHKRVKDEGVHCFESIHECKVSRSWEIGAAACTSSFVDLDGTTREIYFPLWEVIRIATCFKIEFIYDERSGIARGNNLDIEVYKFLLKNMNDLIRPMGKEAGDQVHQRFCLCTVSMALRILISPTA